MSYSAPTNQKQAFTLLEVVLVIVIIVILIGITLPYSVGTLRGLKLKTSARTITRMAQHARGLAIMREKTIGLEINEENMEIYLGEFKNQVNRNNTSDLPNGEIDQDVLSRLGYTDQQENNMFPAGNIKKEIKRKLPKGLTLTEFNRDTLQDTSLGTTHCVRFFSNGQCDWFELEIRDSYEKGIKLEIDSISGKVSSKLIN